MFDFIFALVVGVGIGAYKSKELRPCCDDSFSLCRQKVRAGCANLAPLAQKAKDKVMELTHKAELQESGFRGPGADEAQLLRRRAGRASPVLGPTWVRERRGSREGRAQPPPG
eukprot:CAMPEP_0195101546 /NCGR_PEP_ID=MMETSP0448-20130528/65175_1 /TAXON_ID=66468 /ORGANISM="Heterocapsa triquestra, Strain CCMP 448" /LENGTH=112 /DNA_ID=CAMNT_0040136869 /DNA_START=62 /DNA_END=397 /DNA_ORIENTATION=-